MSISFPKYFPIHLLLELGHILGRSIKESCSPANVRQRTVQSRYADFGFQFIVATSEVNHWPERLCGRGTSQQGTESSAINHTGQVHDALMYFMLWEPALNCALQTYQSQLVRSPQGSQLSHSVTGALVPEWIYTWKSRFLLHAKIQSSQGSCPLACSLYNEIHTE